MKTGILSIIALATMLSCGNAFAIFAADSKSQALLSRANAADPLPGIGSVINATKNMMRVTYDQAVLAATGSLALVDDQGNPALLPKGAIVTNVVMNVITQPLPSTSSIALQLLVAADLMAEKAQSSMGIGFVAGVPVGTAATWKGPVTAAAGSAPTAVLSGSNLTAGKIEWFIEYVIQ